MKRNSPFLNRAWKSAGFNNWLILIWVHLVVLSLEAAPVDQAQNPGFEKWEENKNLQKAKTQTWFLVNGKKPALWNLSSAYPGDLEMVEMEAAEGRYFLKLAARPERAAHLTQATPYLRRSLPYQLSVSYRGGPVELRMYEYDENGKLIAERAFARGEALKTDNNTWKKLTGIYQLPRNIARVTLALVVPEGAQADLDEVKVDAFERSSESVNVRDFGASGSEYETLADTRAGSPVITVADAGDFVPGQEVMVFNCHPHVTEGYIWDEKKGKRSDDFEQQVEVRGYDGTLGARTGYLLDFSGTRPATFRWSDDLGQTWKKDQTVTGDWVPLSGGVEVRLANKEFWTQPRLVTFLGKNQLLATEVKVEGGKLTLSESPSQTVKKCVVQHSDSTALQKAFDRAVGEGRNIFIPSGHYRLSRGLQLKSADGIQLEGENEENTVLDIGTGQGACLAIIGGTSVTVRNLRFLGFSGFSEIKQMGYLPAKGYPHMWGFFIKKCNAIAIRSPERVLIENCHASGMSAECFYSGSSSRKGNDDPPRYTKSIVYRHCTVTDCARNAFNNNDFAENTSVLYCRIQDVGGCAWEGASRFVKFIGNYVRNAGTVAMGNIRSRDQAFDILPSGQHIVAHNTFEERASYGGAAIRSSAGSTPVIITNNLFVNFNSSAIEASGYSNERNLPAANTIISGNAIDLSCVRGEALPRFGIKVSADDAIVSDNQIYLRNDSGAEAEGIVLIEPARNVVVHDNIIRGLELGLSGLKATGSIAAVIDAKSFKAKGRLPWPRRGAYRYQAYRLAWVSAETPELFVKGAVIKSFDADAGLFRLQQDSELKVNARFALYSPQGFSWNIHHNVLSDCSQLVKLNVFGGPTTSFSNNQLSRGDDRDTKIAVALRGAVSVESNQFSGFDKNDSIVLLLQSDPLGRSARFVLRDNSFHDCQVPLAEQKKGLWLGNTGDRNLYSNEQEGNLKALLKPELYTP
ncbi:MAG: hypothetical protein QM496_02315 [Verrucomicrobiota bacterium]